MTKKQLIKIINEIVRREVKKEMNKIFIKEEDTSSNLLDIVPEKQTLKKKEVKYTSNERLNKILNETTGLSKKASEFEEYPTLSGGAFDSSRATELLGYGKPEEVKRDLVAVDTLKKAGKTVDQVPDHVTNALTRDYSGLMKAMDKKK
jgi:hypothetical protein|tara:strand:+ start:5674 stop:6117 length:444 start_codon:yes stop_codon:yes gene_type:complete